LVIRRGRRGTSSCLIPICPFFFFFLIFSRFSAGFPPRSNQLHSNFPPQCSPRSWYIFDNSCHAHSIIQRNPFSRRIFPPFFLLTLQRLQLFKPLKDLPGQAPPLQPSALPSLRAPSQSPFCRKSSTNDKTFRPRFSALVSPLKTPRFHGSPLTVPFAYGTIMPALPGLRLLHQPPNSKLLLYRARYQSTFSTVMRSPRTRS